VQEDGILKLVNKIRYVELPDKPGSYISQANVGFICNNVFVIAAILRDMFQNTPHIYCAQKCNKKHPVMSEYYMSAIFIRGTHQDWNAHFLAEFLHYLIIKDNSLLSQTLFHQTSMSSSILTPHVTTRPQI